jgi:hypothetical protein
MKIYAYDGLNTRDTSAIRLLKLQPGGQENPLKAELVDSSLDAYPPYEALSYTWGNGPPSCQLHIASEHQIAIRPNLKQVLQVLRHTNEERLYGSMRFASIKETLRNAIIKCSL